MKFAPSILTLCATWLVAASLGGRGTAAPADFTVEAPADGKVFTLSAARGKFVALHFLLKTECPYCLKHTRAYALAAGSMPDVVQVFLKPDSVEAIQAWTAKLGRGGEAGAFRIYRDPEARLATQFGIPGGYVFHGETVHYPALVLLDPAGREVFRHVGKNNADRFPVNQFVAKLAELKRQPAVAIEQYNLGPGKLALGGYDPTAYFSMGRAVLGRKELTATHQGVVYQFASEENRRRFLESPDRYAPAYGGWCATAMANGQKVEIDPANFKVTDGRLFLFFKAFYANALKDWNKDEANLTSKADANWKRIAGE